MNPAVEKLFAEKEAERRNEYEATKAEFAEKLLLLGDCWEKEYAENGPYKETLPNGEVRCWKKVPVKLTDEEFERLAEYYPGSWHPGSNGVAVVLKIAAWVLLALGFVLGFMVDAYGELYMAAGVVLCLLFMGLSEIVKKLHSIEQLLKKKEQ